MTERTPFDGKPYYCTLCGAGWNEYGHCEEPDCKLESVRAAVKRKERADAEAYICSKCGHRGYGGWNCQGCGEVLMR